MAKFSKKGWSSDPNYDNFSSGGLERHVDKSRPIEELLARKDDFKNGENYHFTSCCPTPRVTAERGAGAPLRRTRLGAGSYH